MDTEERGEVAAVNRALGREAGQRQSIAVGGQSVRSKAAAVTHNPD